MGLTHVRRRIAGFFSEAPILFIAIVIGIALTFRVAIGWAKSPSQDDAAQDPTLAKTAQPAAETSPSRAATPLVTAEPRPAATATVPAAPRKKPRPRR